LLVKGLNVQPSWDIVSVFHVDVVDAAEICSRSEHCWALPPPHVPLHILKSVFLI
jgi:hypothetical protein